jgi:hypothetical protein
MLRPILRKLAQLQTYNVVAIAQTLPATASSVKTQFYDRAIKEVGVVGTSMLADVNAFPISAIRWRLQAAAYTVSATVSDLIRFIQMHKLSLPE